ncbi:MAG: GspE/PulE family protein, partial [Planctomycetota bacterium]
MASRFDKRIARIVEEAGVVEGEQLEKLLGATDGGKSTLSHELVKAGHIEENELLGLLSGRLRVPPINLHDCTLDQEVVKVLSKEIATEHQLVPISRIDNVLTVAVSNPFDVVVLDQVRNSTSCDLRLVLSLDDTIAKTLNRIYNPGAAQLEAVMGEMGDANIELKQEDVDELDIEAMAHDDDESPVIKFVNLIVYQAIKERASDIHIEPFEKVVRVRFRGDGVCYEAFKPPRALLNSIVSRIKIMCGLDIAERRRPQDGKFQIKVEGRQIDFRVSVLPTV